MKPSVIILSFNSAKSIQATVERAIALSDDVVVVDSFSSDETISMVEAFGARTITHVFESYGDQRNWAMDALELRNPWQLHLDADEWMSDALIEGIRALPDDPLSAGFLVPRYLKFLGRVMKHGGMSPTWHLRLFRAGSARCETRKYDQHFHLKKGLIGRLPGYLLDDVRMPLTEWTSRHNRWSDAEVEELIAKDSIKVIQPKALGNAIEKKRFWRERYNSLPLFVRPTALFAYRYIFRLGFLDGQEGLIFWTLQTFWFRFLVDAKLFERSQITTDVKKNASGSTENIAMVR